MDKTFGGITDQDLEGTQLNSRRAVNIEKDVPDQAFL